MLPISKAFFYTATLSLILAPTTHIRAAAELTDENQESVSAADRADSDQQVLLAYYRNDLITAVSQNDPQTIYALLSDAQIAGANPAWIIDSIITEEGDPLLHVAARHQNGFAIQALLDYKANPNIAKPNVPYEGKVALHGAAKRGTDAVRLLLRAQASTDIAMKPSLLTPLHVAVIEDKREAVALLLKCYANPNARDHSEETSLHKAARNFEPYLVQALLNNGASFHARNKDGKLPEELANARVRKAIEDFEASGAHQAPVNMEAPHYSFYEYNGI